MTSFNVTKSLLLLRNLLRSFKTSAKRLGLLLTFLMMVTIFARSGALASTVSQNTDVIAKLLVDKNKDGKLD